MSNKMWAGVTSGITDSAADSFNSSISFDSRMYRQDIRGSMAHARMLAKCGIITDADRDAILGGLEGILADLDSGALAIDMSAEDIHMFVEDVLTRRIGDTGKKLHTARSRNDQVALDIRLYLRDETDTVIGLTRELIAALTDRAEEYRDAVMPGYTHLQRAQPITYGHYLMAYAMMLLRDIGRLNDCKKRMNASPIGCCALAGTTFPTDREYEAELLGFDSVMLNSLDGVSDRDFGLELLSAFSVLMMHLSRLAEETVLFASWEFRFITLSDAFTTGSSIMPQKKNPDMAELVRGKTGRVYGDLVSLLTAMKGLPLAYNKDMQEDKERLFDACDSVKACLGIFTGMIRTLNANPQNMRNAAKRGFINATDLADYLVGKGLPFRSAYKVSGQLVAYASENSKVLEELTVDEYRAACPLIEADVYDAVNLDNCVSRRCSLGGTSPAMVQKQIDAVRAMLSEN